MAGDWIKVRGGLISHPKVIRMARHLQDCEAFREWLTPGGSSTFNGQIVSDGALRCVTVALLTVTWAWSREFGKRVGDDCFLEHINIIDLDNLAGAPGLGEAMEAVGWARDLGDDAGVLLPKFFEERNVPLSNAEKQRAYRRRKQAQESNQSVTNALPRFGNKTVTPVTTEEKRREEKSKTTTPPTPPKGKPDDWPQVQPLLAGTVLDCDRFRDAWADWAKDRRERGAKLTSRAIKGQIGKLLGWGLDGAIASIRQSIERGYTGVFEARPDRSHGEGLRPDHYSEAFKRKTEQEKAQRRADYEAALAEDKKRKATGG